MTTLDFELEISPGVAGRYPVVARAPGGEVATTLRWSLLASSTVVRRVQPKTSSHGSATQLQIVLEADLPAEAYQALIALDLSAFRQGPVHYDRQHGKWRSELDEWQQPQVTDSGPV